MKIKAFLDTNVIMDVLQAGRPASAFSQIIFQAVFERRIEAVITSQSVIDASYIVFKSGAESSFFKTLEKWFDYINMDRIDTFDLRWAIRNFSGDFEDDAQVSRALDTFCDVFVTGDRKLREKYAHKYEFLLFMSPEEFVNCMKGESAPGECTF